MVVSDGGVIPVPDPLVEVHPSTPKALGTVVGVDHPLGLEANHLGTTSVEVSSNMVSVLGAIVVLGIMVIARAIANAVALETEPCRQVPNLAKANRRVARNRTLLVESVSTSPMDIASSVIDALTYILLLPLLVLRNLGDIENTLDPQAHLSLDLRVVVEAVEAKADLATHVLDRAADLPALAARRGLANRTTISVVGAKEKEAGMAETLRLPRH